MERLTEADTVKEMLQVTEREPIPFDTETEYFSSMFQGEATRRQQGQEGEKEDEKNKWKEADSHSAVGGSYIFRGASKCSHGMGGRACHFGSSR